MRTSTVCAMTRVFYARSTFFFFFLYLGLALCDVCIPSFVTAMLFK